METSRACVVPLSECESVGAGKNEFMAKVFLKNNLKISKSLLCIRAQFSLKHPGVLKFYEIKGTQFILPRNYFIFCLNFRKFEQIIQQLWAKKGLVLIKMGILGHF